MRPKIYIKTSFIRYFTNFTNRYLVTCVRQQLRANEWEVKKF